MISIEELQKINPELLEMAEAPSRELVDEYLLEVGAAMRRRAERLQSHQRRMAAYRRIQAPRKRIRKHMRPFPQ